MWHTDPQWRIFRRFRKTPGILLCEASTCSALTLKGARPLRSVTVLTINKLQQFSVDVVETARENLVILPYRRQSGRNPSRCSHSASKLAVSCLDGSLLSASAHHPTA